MVRHGDGHRTVGDPFLHDDMAAATPDVGKTVGRQDTADFAAGKDSKPSQH